MSSLHDAPTGPKPGDLVIRDLSLSPHQKLIVADANTHRPVCGPFGSLLDAITAARTLRPDARIWRSNLDQRGRELGPPTPLPV